MDRAADQANGLGPRERVERLEAGYEYLLAYAAQGLPADAANGRDGEARSHLLRMSEALGGLAAAWRERASGRAEALRYEPFLEVLERDARSATAAIELVLAQPAIGSQLIDNFNASIHVRALLTDVFLIDEALARAPEAE
jgi:hypothetical protein